MSIASEVLPTRSYQYQESMEAFCQRLEEHPEIQSAVVNDFGFFDNFDIHIVPVKHTRHTTRTLRSIVNKELKKEEAHIRDVFPPEPYCQPPRPKGRGL